MPFTWRQKRITIYRLTNRESSLSPYFPSHCKGTSRAVDGRLQVFWSEHQEASTRGRSGLGTSAAMGRILQQHQTRTLQRVHHLHNSASRNAHFTYICLRV